jgi:hypothetical protein
LRIGRLRVPWRAREQQEDCEGLPRRHPDANVMRWQALPKACAQARDRADGRKLSGG